MNNKENRARAASRLLTVLGENCNDIVVLRDERGIKSGEFRDIDLFSHSLKPYLMSDIWKREAIKQKFSILRIVKRFHYLQFFIYCEQNNTHLILDIWDTLNIKGVKYVKIDEKNIKPSRIKNISSLTDEFSLFVAITKCLTQAGKIKEKYLDSMSRAEYIEACRQYKLPFWVLSLEGKSKLFINIFLFCKFAGRAAYWKWLISLASYCARNKQRVIYLIGPDGAGKSTSSALIKSDFASHPRVDYFHGGIHVLPRISDIIYLLKNGKVKPKSKKRYDPEIAVNSKHNEAGSKQFTVYHFIYYLIDACLGRVYIAINFWRDRLILCDRTIYDIVARQGYSTISPWMKSALILLTPKPDLAIL